MPLLYSPLHAAVIGWPFNVLLCLQQKFRGKPYSPLMGVNSKPGTLGLGRQTSAKIFLLAKSLVNEWNPPPCATSWSCLGAAAAIASAAAAATTAVSTTTVATAAAVVSAPLWLL